MDPDEVTDDGVKVFMHFPLGHFAEMRRRDFPFLAEF